MNMKCLQSPFWYLCITVGYMTPLKLVLDVGLKILAVIGVQYAVTYINMYVWACSAFMLYVSGWVTFFAGVTSKGSSLGLSVWTCIILVLMFECLISMFLSQALINEFLCSGSQWSDNMRWLLWLIVLTIINSGSSARYFFPPCQLNCEIDFCIKPLRLYFLEYG